ncbi:MAG: hypothetical protein AB8F74_13695 [Saprospiraceae bacterium]
MKSFTSILALCLFLVASLSAQDGKSRKGDMRSLRIAYLTKELQLTPQEAEKFWPIYNEYEKERKKLRKDARMTPKGAPASDEAAEEMVDASFERQEDLLKLKKDYYGQMKTVISTQKLAKLDKAEREFRRKVVNEVKRRKQQRKGGK